MEVAPRSGASARVLVVEDEPDIAALIAYQLTREGYRVETAGNGPDGLKAVNREIPDLIVLDRMLPGLSGDEVLKSLRQEAATKAIPVLVLTAKREQEDRITGLELGADDYITKPFSPRELVLRCQAILRRIQERGSTPGGRVLTAGTLRMDLGAHQASLDDEELSLRPMCRTGSRPARSTCTFAVCAPSWGMPGIGWRRCAASGTASGSPARTSSTSAGSPRMRLRIHHTLFAGFLGVVVLLVVLVVSLVGRGLRRELTMLVEGEVGRELELARLTVEAAPVGADPDSLAGALTARIGHRVTLIADDGRVLGDSDVRSPELGTVENHAARPEVMAAREGGVGFAERESATTGVGFL
jgi:CheY-like chemotaxis protein